MPHDKVTFLGYDADAETETDPREHQMRKGKGLNTGFNSRPHLSMICKSLSF